jgi:hypothetical protein
MNGTLRTDRASKGAENADTVRLMRMQHSRAKTAALIILAGLGLWGAGPLRAGDDPPAPESKQQDEDNHRLFREERDLVQPLRADLLDHVTDSAGMPVLPEKPPSDRDKAKSRAYLVLCDEWECYCDAVAKAAKTSPKVFADYARPELTYAHLFNEPRKYRGQVVHFEGELHRVRRYDPPLLLTQAGVQNLYEGWMFAKAYGANPVCVIFTELPPGLHVAEQMSVPAAFDGYFFKKYRYKAGNDKPGMAHDVPLVIGHAPVLTGAVAEAGPSTTVWSGSLLIILVVLVLGTLGLAIGLHWWFHRGDSNVRRRVANAREFTPPLAEPAGEPPPAQPETHLPARWPPDPSAS